MRGAHALIREDATQSMPPYDLWLRGRDDIFTWWFGPGIGCRGSRVIPTVAANGSPAFGQYKPARAAATSRGRCRCSSSTTAGSSSSPSSSTPRRCSRSSGCPPHYAGSTSPRPRTRSARAARASAPLQPDLEPVPQRAELEPRERADRPDVRSGDRAHVADDRAPSTHGHVQAVTGRARETHRRSDR